MVALSNDRNTPKANNGFTHGARDLAPTTTVFAGSLVGQTSAGLAVPARPQASITMLGCARHRASTELAGLPTSVEFDRGVFRFANSPSADAITLGDYGKTVYAVDDQTVAKTNGGGARPAAGIVRNVDALGVWIEL
ncbi:hypothetical protein [Azospirillum agricola]|uniref:hypothetical protein n=1 Tax=Azospirillum agricola TaxID=1720247 RepID=UPI000A0F33E4|nr:hypothetical protein [Azospirillum agricola]SMH62538.1 hypothetical protein SAMN02982994_6341 [Azospirillum lipoferum]